MATAADAGWKADVSADSATDGTTMAATSIVGTWERGANSSIHTDRLP